MIGALLDAICARLRDRLPGVRSVERHGGSFDLEELKRIAVQAPCVRVALVGCGRAERESSGELVLPLSLALVVVARDSAVEGVGRTPRDAAAMALASAAMMAVDRSRFGLANVGAPKDLSAVNEYSGQVDRTGVAIWQVTWTQAIALGESFEQAIAALSELWINGEPFGPGIEPPNASPVGAPFEAPALLPSFGEGGR
jgi:hypothetical protein